MLGFGLNPLVRAATPLLLVIGRVRGASSIDVADLRRLAMAEIRSFEENAAEAGVRNEIVLAARYALCAALDEAVLSTPSGAQSEWAPHPMLVALHREAWGGEKFFEMLDRLLADPARHIDLIELQYLIIALGFTGKYQMIARGLDQLADLQRNVYRIIRTHRGAAPTELSLRWRGLEDRRSRLVRYVPWWVVVAAGLLVVAGTFIFYYTQLQRLADPVQGTLAAIGTKRTPPPPPPPEAPTLKKLLTDLIARGVLTVDENGGESVVTLNAANMFASARATVNPVHRQTLNRIADELNKLPGTVIVIGHTDDQALRSLDFRDNYHLSQERAVEVARILQERLKDPSRVTEMIGRGPDVPLDPQNRDRNRRVEIIHRYEP